ncbi:hypothetical protein LTR66_005491 [Elasticomyces elasticus]|nr:hypothetical protein LTR66_005491 [Elasticomyces elasticus]
MRASDHEPRRNPSSQQFNELYGKERLCEVKDLKVRIPEAEGTHALWEDRAAVEQIDRHPLLGCSVDLVHQQWKPWFVSADHDGCPTGKKLPSSLYLPGASFDESPSAATLPSLSSLHPQGLQHTAVTPQCRSWRSNAARQGDAASAFPSTGLPKRQHDYVSTDFAVSLKRPRSASPYTVPMQSSVERYSTPSGVRRQCSDLPPSPELLSLVPHRTLTPGSTNSSNHTPLPSSHVQALPSPPSLHCPSSQSSAMNPLLSLAGTYAKSSNIPPPTSTRLADLQHPVVPRSSAFDVLQHERVTLLQKLERQTKIAASNARRADTAESELNSLTIRNEDMGDELKALESRLEESERKRSKETEAWRREREQWGRMLAMNGRLLQKSGEEKKKWRIQEMELLSRINTLQHAATPQGRERVEDNVLNISRCPYVGTSSTEALPWPAPTHPATPSSMPQSSPLEHVQTPGLYQEEMGQLYELVQKLQSSISKMRASGTETLSQADSLAGEGRKISETLETKLSKLHGPTTSTGASVQSTP